MKIQRTTPYKSLRPFTSEELPDFTIIVGRNGSGKSQLVEKFNQLKKIKSGKTKGGFLLFPEMDSIYTETLAVSSINMGNPMTYRNQFVTLINKHNEYVNVPSIFKIWQNLAVKGILRQEIERFTIDTYEDIQTFKDLVSTQESRFVSSDLEYLGFEVQIGVDQTTLNYYDMFLHVLKLSLPFFEASVWVANYHKKKLDELFENDFLSCSLPSKFIEKNDLNESKIEDIFYNYLRKRNTNEAQYVKKLLYKASNTALTPDEFDNEQPNPMVQINNILNTLNLPYYFREISAEEFNPEGDVHFDFIKKTNESKIQLQDLSSGEKIIIGLITRLFTSEFYSLDLRFPDLMILDEPDAHLHPEMSKILIDVLNESFVKNLGMKVIITTHSPTTVALAPEDSIFQLQNDPTTFLKKIQKDGALRILTVGLPNLSIDYKNHRQVFVESPTDLEYYQTIFSKMQTNTNLIHQLYFISNGYGKGNCDQVKKIVRDLRQAGNQTTFGIIDWDNKNLTTLPIHVHGDQKRYSIENYIFDPIFVSILLLERGFGIIKKELDYKNTDNQYDLIKTDKAQKAIDYIVSSLEPRNKSNILDTRTVTHKYGEYSYNIPKWFTQLRGHNLKEQLVDQFEPLTSIKNTGEYEIERKLIAIIAKVYPNVPGDTIELLGNLAS